MGILNINTIQANINNDDVLKYTDEYVKEALTNLGQRVGAKGDSLSVDGFTIKEIIKDLTVVESSISTESVNKKYIIAYNDPAHGIVIYYNNKTYKFNDFNTVDYSKDTFITLESAKGAFTTLESAKGETPSLFVNYIIHNTDNGKIFISKDYDANSCNNEIKRILALEFDKQQKLINYVYVQLQQPYIDVYSLKDGNKRYELNVQFNYNDLYAACFIDNNDNSIKSIYEKICVFLTDTNISSTIIERNYNLETYWETVLISYINSIFNDKIFNANNQYTGLKQYIIYSVLNHIISNIAANDNIEFLKIYINDDFVFRYFINDNTKQIYYSYDFNIHYVPNINDDKTFEESYITDNNLDNNYIFVVTDLNNIPEKITNNRFVVSYTFDTLLNTLFLDNIIIDLNYTLPYIFTSNNSNDNNKYWYINDEFTNIQSNGKHAGQPNILILGYTKINDEDITPNVDILHTFVSDEISEDKIKELNNIDTTFNYDLDKVVSVNGNPGNVFEFKIKLPDINALINYNSAYEQIFANCLLWTVVDTKLGKLNDITLYQKLNLKENKNETIASNNTSYVTVFWHPELTENGWTWEYLKDPSNNSVALDLGSLCGLTETTYYLLNTKYEPDNYLHSYVIFDKVNNTTPKNTQQNTDTNNYTRYPALCITGADESQTLDSRAESNICEFRPMFLTSNEVVTTINTGVLDKPAEISQTKESAVFNNIKTINIPNSTTIGDYIPGSDSTGFAPLFNFGSVLTYNQTALNRISLLSIDKKGDAVNVYNSYIGFEGNQRRNELTIGTSKTNTNIKNDGRLNTDTSFKQHNRLNIQMPMLAHQGVLNKSAVNNNTKKTKVFYIIISDIAKNIKAYLKEDTDVVNGTKYMDSFNKVVDCFDILSYLKNVIKLNNIIKSPKTTGASSFIKLQSKYTDDDIISIIVFLEETNALFQIINANEIISPDNVVSKYGIQRNENDFFDKTLIKENPTGVIVDNDVFIPEFNNTPFESY